MRITFKQDAVTDSIQWKWIDRILQRIDDGAHEWNIDDPEILESTTWLGQIRTPHRELFEGAAKKSAYPNQGPYKKTVIVSSNPTATELSPSKAAIFLDQPLLVIMENQFTDGVLLDCALSFLGSTASQNLYNNRPYKLIKYISAGGNGEIPKHVNDQLNEAAQLGIPARFVVFTDSDGKYPGETNREAEIIKKTCIDNGIYHCILKKRAIENYIPDEVFFYWRDKIENKSYFNFINAILNLSSEQRDHFPLKSGWNEKKVHLPLYEDLSEEKRKIISRALGTDLINWLNLYKSSVSEAALRNRDQHGDLDFIVKIINDQI
jgi:hypothetical protein